MENHHVHWMRRVLELARIGWGRTNPNPLVGCVIVEGETVIAEGYHAAVGLAHAERSAILQARDEGVSLEGKTLYVNLEPCVHHGKTPPCVDLIIESGIAHVVVSMEDPNPLMAGAGIRMLQQAGVRVTTGVLESEARQLNEIFTKYMTTGLPFVLMKTAISVDGKIAANTGDARWISGEQSRTQAHHWRQRVSGILVGKNTVMIDNPSLTTRLPGQETRNPVRIVVDSKGDLPEDSHVFLPQAPGSGQTEIILATTSRMDRERQVRLETAGVEVVCLEDGKGQVDLPALLLFLGKKGMDSVLLEGGGRLNEAFLHAGLIDRILLFLAPKIIGGSGAVSCFHGMGIDRMSDAVQLDRMTITPSGEDWLIDAYPVYKEVRDVHRND